MPFLFSLKQQAVDPWSLESVFEWPTRISLEIDSFSNSAQDMGISICVYSTILG